MYFRTVLGKSSSAIFVTIFAFVLGEHNSATSILDALFKAYQAIRSSKRGKRGSEEAKQGNLNI